VKVVRSLLAALLCAGALLLAADPARAAETPAYVALGDSIAFGVGATTPDGGGYVALAFDRLRRSDRYVERGLGLTNLAAPGATSADLLLPGGQLETALRQIAARQEDTSSSDDNVEIISVNIGGNDLLAVASSASPCLQDAAGQACRERLGEMLRGLQDNLHEVLERLRGAAPKAGIYVIGLYNPYSGTGDPLESIADAAVQQLNGVIGAVTADEDLGVELVDIFQGFRGRGAQWISSDGLHPNEKGHAVIAELLLAAIEKRAAVLPAEALAEPPAPAGPPAGDLTPARSGGGVDGALVLAIALPIAFAAGVLITGAYFVARGRGA
jgi:lysophospholipase L1-like esterase